MSNAVDFAQQRIADVQDRANRFGNRKLNLIRDDTDSREGIWCVPVTAEDRQKMLNDDSRGDKFRAYLTNIPLPWGGRCWGAEVVGTTCGHDRPIALPADQVPLDDEVKLLWQGLKLLEENEAIK